MFNQATEDEPEWVILDATVERLDPATLRVTDRDGALIAVFQLDPTPLDDRITC